MNPSHHSVMFCCNDEHGLPTGHVDEIDIANEIQIVCQKSGPTFRLVDKYVRVGRYHYPHLGWQPWIGNIFWNAATMHVADARTLIRNLLANGWAVEEWAEEGPFAHLAKRSKEPRNA